MKIQLKIKQHFGVKEFIMDINLELERLNKSKNDILDKLVTCRDINVINQLQKDLNVINLEIHNLISS